MFNFKPPTVVMPQYRRGRAEPSPLQRSISMLLYVAIAALYGVAVIALPSSLYFLLMLPTLAILMISLWLMPDRKIFPVKTLTSVFSILIVLQVLWPTYLAIVLPGLPWVTPSRMLLFISIGILLYSTSISSAVRTRIVNVMRSSPLFFTFFVLWQLSMLVTIPFSHDVIRTLKILVDDELHLAGLFLLGCVVFNDARTTVNTARCLVILAVICSIDGFLELRLGYPPWANHIPSFMRVDDQTLTTVLGAQSRAGDGLYRVRGPFTNSLILSEFFALCTPLIIHWLVNAKSIMTRFAMTVIWILVVYGILITQSRLGLIGTMVAIGIYLPIWGYRRWRESQTSLVGPVILLGAPIFAVLFIALVFSSHSLTMRVLGGGAQSASTEARGVQRQMALPKVAHNPLGYGLGQSGEVLGFISPSGVITVDSHFITSLLDLGVFGAIGYYGMYLSAAFLGIRAYLKSTNVNEELIGALSISLVVFFVTNSVLSEESNHPLAFVLLSMTMTVFARYRGTISSADFDVEAFRVNRGDGRSVKRYRT